MPHSGDIAFKVVGAGGKKRYLVSLKASKAGLILLQVKVG